MWQCTKCREEIEDSFDTCWACGTSRDGAEDPLFQPVADQPPFPTRLAGIAGLRGLKAGATVAVVMAFVHPFILLLVSRLVYPAAITVSEIGSLLFFGFLWALFAAVGGGIAGTIGARARTERSSLVAGLLSGVLSHVFFLTIITNAFGHWPSQVLLGSLSLAALSGTITGFVGFLAGQRCRAQFDAETPPADSGQGDVVV
jgi:hypothetical protein